MHIHSLNISQQDDNQHEVNTIYLTPLQEYIFVLHSKIIKELGLKIIPKSKYTKKLHLSI